MHPKSVSTKLSKKSGWVDLARSFPSPPLLLLCFHHLVIYLASTFYPPSFFPPQERVIFFASSQEKSEKQKVPIPFVQLTPGMLSQIPSRIIMNFYLYLTVCLGI